MTDQEMVNEIDKVFADAATDKLERRLSNNEPKCANCRWWFRNGDMTGTCGRYSTIPANSHSFNFVPQVVVPLMTTDLTVCSKWEAK